MRRVIVILSLTPVALISACGSTSSNSNENGNVVVVNANPSANSNVVPYVPPGSQNINSNIANAFNSNAVPSNPTTAANPKYMTYPAPDDSEYSTIMDKSGMPVETRVFRSDPQISKVVRTWLSVDEKKIVIYLRNGKVVNLPGSKIEDIKSVPVSTFYEAAGIKSATSPATVSKPAGKQPSR